MLMAEVLQFWHISCRFDIENLEWAVTWELLKLCKLMNIYTPKASTSAWGFTLTFFVIFIYIYIYIYIYLYYIYIYVYIYYIYYIYIQWKKDFYFHLMDPNGNTNCSESFLAHSCHLRSRGIFSFSYASLLFILLCSL